MYTVLKNVQIIVSLLKQNNISHIVLSPGTRNVPLVHTVQEDSFFTCYSIVDERSAAYFALGLSEALDEPVCISCTSSTATTNYMPAIKEAYERNIQLVALTADRNKYFLNQMEDQMIDQINMYGHYVRFSSSLPVAETDEEISFCELKVNEALLELNHNGRGPVHINFEAINKLGVFEKGKVPNYRKIIRVNDMEENSVWQKIVKKLTNYNKILLICGQDSEYNNDNIEVIKEFSRKYGVVVSYEYMSNKTNQEFSKTLLAIEGMDLKEFDEYVPELVITIGTQYFSNIKYKLRKNKKRIEHWDVTENGEICDTFAALTHVFECSDFQFFSKMNDCNTTVHNNGDYEKKWVKKLESIKYPDNGFTNFYCIGKFSEMIQSDSIVHLSILNSIRILNFHDVKEKFNCYANLGADGIDGSLSTFLGQASTTSRISYLVIGDLSFFYDVTATLIDIPNNVRIFVINNFAGSEFHKNFGVNMIPALDDFIAARHTSKVEDWIKGTQFDYLSASNEQELSIGLKLFTQKSEKPMILEVFTDAELDAETVKEFYKINQKLSGKDRLINSLKVTIKALLRKLGVR